MTNYHTTTRKSHFWLVEPYGTMRPVRFRTFYSNNVRFYEGILAFTDLPPVVSE